MSPTLKEGLFLGPSIFSNSHFLETALAATEERLLEVE